MKSEDIKSIINESLIREVKDRIIKDQLEINENIKTQNKMKMIKKNDFINLLKEARDNEKTILFMNGAKYNIQEQWEKYGGEKDETCEECDMEEQEIAPAPVKEPKTAPSVEPTTEPGRPERNPITLPGRPGHNPGILPDPDPKFEDGDIEGYDGEEFSDDGYDDSEILGDEDDENYDDSQEFGDDGMDGDVQYQSGDIAGYGDEQEFNPYSSLNDFAASVHGQDNDRFQYGMNENKKTVLRLKESDMVKMIEILISESVPGLQAVTKSRAGSGKDAKKQMADTKKKFAAYEKFEGNDKPEFPKPIGKGEKKARKATSEDQEFTEENRGGGMEDLKYDPKPSPEFTDRLDKAMTGDKRMGNFVDDETGNAIKSEVGENLLKKAKKKAKNKEKEPMYIKDPQPVKNVKESQEDKAIVNDEIARMKAMYTYKTDTQ